MGGNGPKRPARSGLPGDQHLNAAAFERLRAVVRDAVVGDEASHHRQRAEAGAPPAILDWNNNYRSEVEKCVCTHCGNFPKKFMGVTPDIDELDVLGEVIGRENCCGAVKGKVTAGDMTFFRVSSDDTSGTLRGR